MQNKKHSNAVYLFLSEGYSALSQERNLVWQGKGGYPNTHERYSKYTVAP